MILQLAVQGKLTRQWRITNRPELNSKELLEVIKVGKIKVLRESNVKSEKPIKDFDLSEVKFDLPENWVWVRFASAAYICRGGSPRPINNFITDDPDGINWIKIGDTKGVLKYIEECGEKIIPEGLKMSRLVVPGDFILSNSMSFGKPYIMRTTGCIHDGWLLIREVKEAINKDFLYHLLSSPYVYGSFKDSAAGGVVQNLNIEKVRQTLIPLPPLEEQKAIVAIVNQLFAEVEQLEAMTKERIQLKADFVTSALNQLTQATEQDTASQWAFLQQHFGTFFTEKENIKKLREGILQLAVQGKLTRDWRAIRQAQGIPIEHASTLLAKIKAEKEELIKEKKIKKEKPLPEISQEEIPYELPDGWVWCRMGEITTLITDGKHGNCQDEHDSGYYFLSAKDVQKGKLLYDRARQINFKEFSEVHQRTNLEPGDLCIVNTGATVGKTAIALDNELTRKSTFQKSVAVVKILHQFLHIRYLENFIINQTPKLLKKSGGSAINNLLLGDMKRIITPLPPLDEQKAIVEKVNSLMALCDKLEQEIETHQTTQEEWMQSCLREVVEG
ncbi:restriction endonuclease subunit S [Mongoliibacter ruber]|uniref:restriction endonuclease subunit S n=1 Tax=Mongoliibacter ruber TaxID=1750599 RepID=UPI00147481D9|nr:restriction endonuclease subunit S [Mongoliibacter ruber]